MQISSIDFSTKFIHDIYRLIKEYLNGPRE